MSYNFKKVFKKLFPHSFIRLLNKPRIVRFTEADIENARKTSKNKDLVKFLDTVNRSKSLKDEMDIDNGAHYLRVGLSGIGCIKMAINESKPVEIKQILDMPSGHGRVMRFIRKLYPAAEITACDTNKYGVDFCEKEFEADPVYAKHELTSFNIQKKFDLIWCGSLATHFDSGKSVELLKFFYRHLNIGGLLVFSMHGNFVLNRLDNKIDTYGLDRTGIDKIVAETKLSGYGYADYPGDKGYGVSVATPKWIQERLNEVGQWKNCRYWETEWIDHHDIYSVIKDT